MPALLTQVDPLFEVLQRTSRASTNFFASRDQVERWSARGTLCWLETAGCLLIFRRSVGFYHLYHVAASFELLSKSLASGAIPRGVLVSDLVGRDHELSPMVNAYEAARFRRYKSLTRMVRIVDGSLPAREYANVTFAEPSDVAAVRGFLVQLLDPFADQIPEEDELRSAVDRQTILITRQNEGIGGLLIFEKSGLTTTLRYWYVSPESRGQGIGARLMRTFFELSRTCRRIMLWVVSDNMASIEKYLHYGFRRDPLVDQIMIRKNTIEEVLKELRPEFDFTASDDFIGDGMLDSHDVVTLVADLDRTFGISIAGIDIVPENFQSITAIEQLLSKYSAEP
jgi:acyl carrier protein/GNAT superfamily N-acetyltransferase